MVRVNTYNKSHLKVQKKLLFKNQIEIQYFVKKEKEKKLELQKLWSLFGFSKWIYQLYIHS